jgi:DNA-binding NarL/FixJ family response regulator
VATGADTPLRVVIAGDSTILGDGLAALLASVSEVEVLARTTQADALETAVAELEPDAVVVNLRTSATSAMSVIRSARRLREDYPGLGIVIISDRGNGFALELLRGGSAHTAYLLEHQLPGIDDVVLALREVLGGQAVLDPSVADALIRRRDAVAIDHLTIRELEVLEQIASGLSNRAVASELNITVKAVENHVTAIFRKLDLTDRSDLHQRVAAALTYQSHVHAEH